MTQWNPNTDPRTIHHAEQVWADVSAHLDRVIAMITEQEPQIYLVAGNSDSSVLFDFMKGYIVDAERENGLASHLTTVLMCAAAITRIVRAPRTNDPLAQLDKEIDS
jgi:hypothetical protein